MRKLMCMVTFSVLMLGTVVGQQAPSCDGTKPKTIKCNNGVVPPGDFESATCEGDVEGTYTCKHALAFNQDNFDCTAPQLDPAKTPPSYTTYCADSADTVVDCTHRRTCVGKGFMKDGKQYTKCEQSGATDVKTRLVKYERTSSITFPLWRSCVETVPVPGGN